MIDKSPCLYPKICQKRYPGCQSKCEIGRAYFRRQKEKADATKAERGKEVAYLTYKTAQVEHTKKKAGIK